MFDNQEKIKNGIFFDVSHGTYRQTIWKAFVNQPYILNSSHVLISQIVDNNIEFKVDSVCVDTLTLLETEFNGEFDGNGQFPSVDGISLGVKNTVLLTNNGNKNGTYIIIKLGSGG